MRHVLGTTHTMRRSCDYYKITTADDDADDGGDDGDVDDVMEQNEKKQWA